MGLGPDQNRFLAERLTCRTDKEAAKSAKISEDTVGRWKKDDPEFLAAYEHLGEDGIELAKSILRQHLAKAALTLISASEEAINKDGTDYNARISAATKVLQSHGVITERREVTGPDGKEQKVIVEVVYSDGHQKASGGAT